MKAVSHFILTTFLGGVLLLTPIVVVGLLFGKAYDFARRALQPVTALIPDRFASGPTASAILVIIALALACFLAGLLARTVLAQKIVGGVEAAVLSKVPAYEYLKQAGMSVLGVGESAEHPVVLVELGGALRIGLQMDVVGKDLVAVFVPNAPNPVSGAVFLVAANRVRPAGVPLATAMGALRRCGTGSAILGESLSGPRL